MLLLQFLFYPREALENVLSWAHYAQERISCVAVSNISSAPFDVLKFTPLRGNFAAISSSLRAIPKSVIIKM